MINSESKLSCMGYSSRTLRLRITTVSWLLVKQCLLYIKKSVAAAAFKFYNVTQILISWNITSLHQLWVTAREAALLRKPSHINQSKLGEDRQSPRMIYNRNSAYKKKSPILCQECPKPNQLTPCKTTRS